MAVRAEGALVTIEYACRLAADGTEINSTKMAGRPLTIRHGDRMVAAELDHAVRRLPVGQETELELPAGCVLGAARCARMGLDRGAAVRVWVKVLSAEDGGVGGLSDTYLSIAVKLKDEGNVLYKEGSHSEALGKYSKSARLLRGAQAQKGFSSERRKDLAATHTSVRLNMAACFLNREEPDLQRAADACTMVLSEDPKNVKALFRRGQALARMGSTAEALQDMRAASEIDPFNKEAKREAARLRQLEQGSLKAEGKVCAKMFGI